MTGREIHLGIHRANLLTANQRLHWGVKASRTKTLRTTAHVLALAAHGSRPFTERVHCTVTVAWPNARRRDVHNLMPTIKAAIDGVVDANWLEDDSDAYLQGPDLRVSDERCAQDLACSLTIKFEEIVIDPDLIHDAVGEEVDS